VTVETPSDVVAARISALRKRRKWNLKRLAAECAYYGADRLTENVLENIEYGRRGKDGHRRRDVTVDELLVLAAALGVPILALLLPEPHEADTVRIAGDLEVTWATAAGWLAGDNLLSQSAKERAGTDGSILWNETMDVIGHLRDFRIALMQERTAHEDLLREEIQGGGDSERAGMARQLYRTVVMRVYNVMARLIEVGVTISAMPARIAREMLDMGYGDAENPAIREFITNMAGSMHNPVTIVQEPKEQQARKLGSRGGATIMRNAAPADSDAEQD
jgi:transcriptional regulator with XRE-family HTH domain